MGEYSLSEYYYTSPCSWIEETRHGWAKKSLASDIDFALSCFDHGALAFDDFLSTGDKWLRRAESSFFSTHFRSTEREPYAITERIAAVKRTTPFTTTIRKVRSTTAEGWDSSGERVEKTEFSRGGEDYLHELDDRIAALEVGFDNLFDFKASKNQKPCKKESKAQNGRKAEVSYKYLSKRVTDPFTVTHPFPADFSTCRAEAYTLSRPSEPQTRVIPVEDGERSNLARSKKIQNVFARKRAVAAELKGKRKELSPQDAALIIQARFREYLVHRSQTLRVLKELAVAKARLKELRTLFSNYTYRRHLSRDLEERQRFSEKIIVLLLTVDSIAGLDYMVREARRSMIQELESMLAAVDPQASNKAGSSRRKFDLPEPGTVHKEMTMEVSEVVGMLDEQNEGNVFPYVTM